VSGESVNRYIAANVRIGQEGNALGAHLVEAAIEYMLFKFEIRNAVAKQPTNAVVLLVHGDGVAGASELLRSRKPGGTTAYDRNALASVVPWRFRLDPSFVPCA